MPLICIDGPNGAGKTTQAELLASRLVDEQNLDNPFVFFDPGVSDDHAADGIRDLARMGSWRHVLTRAMLFMAARCELVAEINKILAQKPKAWVILDRYIPSFCVYQLDDFLKISGGVMSLAIERMNAIHDMIGAPGPAATFILNIDPTLGIERYRKVSHGKLDVFEKDVDRMYAMYHRYQQLLLFWPSFRRLGPKHVIDVDNLDVNGVHEAMWNVLKNQFKGEIW